MTLELDKKHIVEAYLDISFELPSWFAKRDACRDHVFCYIDDYFGSKGVLLDGEASPTFLESVDFDIIGSGEFFTLENVGQLVLLVTYNASVADINKVVETLQKKLMTYLDSQALPSVWSQTKNKAALRLERQRKDDAFKARFSYRSDIPDLPPLDTVIGVSKINISVLSSQDEYEKILEKYCDSWDHLDFEMFRKELLDTVGSNAMTLESEAALRLERQREENDQIVEAYLAISFELPSWVANYSGLRDQILCGIEAYLASKEFLRRPSIKGPKPRGREKSETIKDHIEILDIDIFALNNLAQLFLGVTYNSSRRRPSRKAAWVADINLVETLNQKLINYLEDGILYDVWLDAKNRAGYSRNDLPDLPPWDKVIGVSKINISVLSEESYEEMLEKYSASNWEFIYVEIYRDTDRDDEFDR
jgi:hypothetical protein